MSLNDLAVSLVYHLVGISRQQEFILDVALLTLERTTADALKAPVNEPITFASAL